MLDLRVAAWPERLQRDQEDLFEVLDGLEDDYRRYVGPYHRRGSTFDEAAAQGDPHNHAFNFIAVWLPRLVFGEPQVDVTTNRVGRERQDAMALEFALNRWSRQVKLRELTEQLAVDFAFRFAVAITTAEPQPGFSDYEDPPMWPSPRRIDPFDFIYDSQTRDRKRWRYVGHRYRRDLEDVIAEAEEHPELGWNLEILRRVPEDGWVSRDWDRERSWLRDENRKEIELIDLWVPEVTIDKLRDAGFDHKERDEDGRRFTPRYGYNGAWFTMGAWQTGPDTEGNDDYVRAPRMAFCRRSGPITFFGGYFVGNDVMPLSPLQATRLQAEHLNKMARARQEAMEGFKRVALVAADDPVVQDAIQNSANGDTVPIEALDEIAKRFAEIEVGGDPQNSILKAEEAALRTLEMASGMAEAQRGEVTGRGTATENDIAREATQTRVGMLATKFREGVKSLFEDAGHYLWKRENAPMRLPKGGLFMSGENRGRQLRFAQRFFKDDKIGPGQVPLRQIPESVLARYEREDDAKLEDQMEDPWDGLDIAIHPYSMERTAEGMQQMRLQNVMGLITGLLPLVPQMPWVRWDELFQMIAQFANVPEFPALVDVQTAQQVGQMMMQAQMQQAATGGKGGGGGGGGGGTGYVQPRLGIDLGPYGSPLGGMGSGGTLGKILPGQASGQALGAGRR